MYIEVHIEVWNSVGTYFVSGFEKSDTSGSSLTYIPLYAIFKSNSRTRSKSKSTPKCFSSKNYIGR